MMRLTRSKVGSRKKKHIDLSKISYDSTCISLCLPFSMLCQMCQRKSDPLSNHRVTKNTRKKELHKARKKWCQQYWLLKWANKNSSYLQTHICIQNYLNVKKCICIETENLNFKRNCSQLNSILDLSTANNSFSTIPSFLVKGSVDQKKKSIKQQRKNRKSYLQK